MTSSPATLRDLLLEAVASHPEDPGLYWTQPDGSQQWLADSERLGRARVVAELASRLGLAPGDRAAVLVPNDPARSDLLFGLASMGVVVVPLDPTLPPAETVRRIRESGATVAFADAPDASLAAELPAVRFVVGAGVPYPSAPSAQTDDPSAYPALFSDAIVAAFSSGAAFDRFVPAPDTPALWEDGRETTHAQLADQLRAHPAICAASSPK